MSNPTPVVILMVDDDEDDRLLSRDALEESRVLNDLRFAYDGQECLDYLNKEGKFAEQDCPRPGLILLDLNMPKKDGRQTLAEIKAHPLHKNIPVVILTTSKAEEDMIKGYDLGAASYIRKPVNFEDMVELMKAMGKYWIEIVDLPNGNSHHGSLDHSS